MALVLILGLEILVILFIVLLGWFAFLALGKQHFTSVTVMSWIGSMILAKLFFPFPKLVLLLFLFLLLVGRFEIGIIIV
jgi:hypothetical protein